jgi:hypothetical protein
MPSRVPERALGAPSDALDRLAPLLSRSALRRGEAKAPPNVTTLFDSAGIWGSSITNFIGNGHALCCGASANS